MKKILLIGYRATGKSSLGKRLAALLNLPFYDTDLLVERQAGTIRDFVATNGWAFFRAREKAVLVSLIDLPEGVIATGGGAVLHQDVWPQLMASGLVVWLTAAPETIRRRLAGDRQLSAVQRPSLTGEDISEEIEQVLAERENLYRNGAHLELSSEDKTCEELAAIIIAQALQGNETIDRK